ncbi:hypothetical protein GGTG_03503 [Gaeumannomyces tritici R3-111a-1]|uniref:Uncharacterized protein n=1 Tax=Gaeumannomyces tritici (strain R3-111a-1) TaxID=644352 RepID=J3NQE6_GAET3|nr:hypothetical protein GGTG_03503 [Gaeumannomyces tritici R3-111a-1]EJT78402.1 hypothetical protein GGTG_03503 [Gaeumannomyces tritici R3-111a-1]
MATPHDNIQLSFHLLAASKGSARFDSAPLVPAPGRNPCHWRITAKPQPRDCSSQGLSQCRSHLPVQASPSVLALNPAVHHSIASSSRPDKT